MSVACVVICDGRREALLDSHVLPTILPQGFDEVLVVGKHHNGEGYRYLEIEGITNTTLDALIKRDTAAVATESRWILYLCDDHRLPANFLSRFRLKYACCGAKVVAPSRFCLREGGQVAWLNVGQGERYVGGHGIVIQRNVLRDVPWLIAPRVMSPRGMLWDKTHSHVLLSQGYDIEYAGNDLAIEDIDLIGNPNAEKPWL